MKLCQGLNRYWPVPARLAQHLADNGSVSACTLWTHHRQQKALSSVEWLLARAGDDGPALNRHWVDVSCLLGSVVGDLSAYTGRTYLTLSPTFKLDS